MYGEVIKNVYVSSTEDLSIPERREISNKLNTNRSYREFQNGTKCSVICNMKPTEFKDGDAGLLIGIGRIISRKSYFFAMECMQKGIPVYYKRKISYAHDSDKMLWKVNSICTNVDGEKKYNIQSNPFYQEIPSMADIAIMSKPTEDCYAILPTMA